MQELSQGYRGPYAKWGKRLADILLALIASALLCPILIAIAIVIRILDRGPGLFVQERIGRQGRPFRLFKFRTMPIGTKSLPSDQLGKLHLTWFPRFLRRSNLDELPQLFNILKGDMSIVGPRPSLVAQTELIVLRNANGALEIRPGLTGLAQIRSYSGMPAAEKATLDGHYASRITLIGDIAIIARTFLYLTKPPPVY
jgi:O-antigen biosynthesis protein WbqP